MSFLRVPHALIFFAIWVVAYVDRSIGIVLVFTVRRCGRSEQVDLAHLHKT